MSDLKQLEPSVSAAPTDSYISLPRGGQKFGILQVTADRLDVGIKLKGQESGGRLEAASDWNSMVTHRVRSASPARSTARSRRGCARAWSGHERLRPYPRSVPTLSSAIRSGSATSSMAVIRPREVGKTKTTRS